LFSPKNSKCTDKKENQIFLIHNEIQSEAVAKSYMGKGFLYTVKNGNKIPGFPWNLSFLILEEPTADRGKFCTLHILDFFFLQLGKVFLAMKGYFSPGWGMKFPS
jgi:hypothetical protein